MKKETGKKLTRPLSVLTRPAGKISGKIITAALMGNHSSWKTADSSISTRCRGLFSQEICPAKNLQSTSPGFRPNDEKNTAIDLLMGNPQLQFIVLLVLKA